MNQDDSPTPPQQLAQFVVFSLDEEEYAVPVLAVAEVVPLLEITPFPDAPQYIVGLANLRGKILPVLDLEKRFRLHATNKTPKHIMVAQNEQQVQFGILVDRVSEVIKIPTSSIQPSPEMLKTKIGAEYLPGVIVIEPEEGAAEQARMLLILDLAKILPRGTIEHLRIVQQTAKKPMTEQPITKEERT